MGLVGNHLSYLRNFGINNELYEVNISLVGLYGTSLRIHLLQMYSFNLNSYTSPVY